MYLNCSKDKAHPLLNQLRTVDLMTRPTVRSQGNPVPENPRVPSGVASVQVQFRFKVLFPTVARLSVPFHWAFSSSLSLPLSTTPTHPTTGAVLPVRSFLPLPLDCSASISPACRRRVAQDRESHDKRTGDGLDLTGGHGWGLAAGWGQGSQSVSAHAAGCHACMRWESMSVSQLG